jgi:hypothetical protein
VSKARSGLEVAEPTKDATDGNGFSESLPEVNSVTSVRPDTQSSRRGIRREDILPRYEARP